MLHRRMLHRRIITKNYMNGYCYQDLGKLHTFAGSFAK
jgi:hypothetical protein